MERDEVQTMVDLAIAKFHGENVVRMTRIEDRIIGIDGNGTGKKGALQRLDAKVDQSLQHLGSKVDKVCTDVETLLRRSTLDNFSRQSISVSKKTVYGILGAIGVAAMGFVGALAAEYVKHIAGWR